MKNLEIKQVKHFHIGKRRKKRVDYFPLNHRWKVKVLSSMKSTCMNVLVYCTQQINWTETEHRLKDKTHYKRTKVPDLAWYSLVNLANTTDVITSASADNSLTISPSTVTIIMWSTPALSCHCTWSSLTCDGKLLQNRGWSFSIKPGLMNPPVRSLPKQDPAVERPRNSITQLFPLSFSCVSLHCYHFRTKLSQSPRTATQISLSPVSLRRWNQIGKKKKNAVCRSATVDARLNKPLYVLYLVCRWTANSTPQLWRRSMISQPLSEDDTLNLFCYCGSPIGLYSMLANLFALGTLQT